VYAITYRITALATLIAASVLTSSCVATSSHLPSSEASEEALYSISTLLMRADSGASVSVEELSSLEISNLVGLHKERILAALGDHKDSCQPGSATCPKLDHLFFDFSPPCKGECLGGGYMLALRLDRKGRCKRAFWMHLQ